MVRGMKSSNFLFQIVKQRAVEKCAHADIETVAQLFDRVHIVTHIEDRPVFLFGHFSHLFQAFFLKLERNGKDLYPELRKLLDNPEYYAKEVVRNEMFKHFDYYVTESSGHNSEYNQWFRKRPDLLKKYCTPAEYSNWNPGEYAFSLNLRKERKANSQKQYDE